MSWSSLVRLNAVLIVVFVSLSPAWAQSPSQPPELEVGLADDFEMDENQDGLPDGWFNSRDHELKAKGGHNGPKSFRFQTDKPGRPSKAHRGMPVPGDRIEAVVIGVWAKTDDVHLGEKIGDSPAVIIDFLGEGMSQPSRASMTIEAPEPTQGWFYQSKKFPVAPETTEGIVSLGLMGSVGAVEFDGLTISFIPRGGIPTTNLVRNGDLELGNPNPPAWSLENGAKRTHPGYRSNSSLEFSSSKAVASCGLGRTLEGISEIEISIWVKTSSIRSTSGAGLQCFFLDRDGQVVRDAGETTVFEWISSFDWKQFRKTLRVPQKAQHAVVQIEKAEAYGTLRVDQLEVVAKPDPKLGQWLPDHEQDDVTTWKQYLPATAIESKSALDFSFLVDPKRVQQQVVVRNGRLAYANGPRAKFFGVGLMSPLALESESRTEALADRLMKSGVNLVRLLDLDQPLGPGRSLIDQIREDTRRLDPEMVDRLQSTLASFEKKGLAIALDLQSQRRFRVGDGLKNYRELALGGGPWAAFDPKVQALAREFGLKLLSEANPKTGFALKDDPALIWVALGAEHSLFDLTTQPDPVLRRAAGSSSRSWRQGESAAWSRLASELKADGVKALIAGSSHWKRDADLSAAQAADQLDLIDDRMYLSPKRWSPPWKRSLLWSDEPSLVEQASKKRKSDRPYVLGLWCRNNMEGWASPYEGADLLVTSLTAAREDWDGVVRRGVFLFPEVWGAGPAGSTGGLDWSPVSGVLNAAPQVFEFLPHAASLFFRTDSLPNSSGKAGVESRNGLITIDTPYTQGVAGWQPGREIETAQARFAAVNPYAVIVASSATTEPLARSKRILVSAIAHVAPTGLRWSDSWRTEMADLGRGPLRIEPVSGEFFWKQPDPNSKIKAYALDNSGHRADERTLERVAAGVRLKIDGSALHWELIIEGN